MKKTDLSNKLKLKYPIILAPMFLVSNKEMIVNAAASGILGTFPAPNFRNPTGLENFIVDIQNSIEKPFGINIFLSFRDEKRIQNDIEVATKLKTPVIITSAGNPSEVVRKVKKYDGIVMHTIRTFEEAKDAELAGVDAIIALCTGGGGFAGINSPFAFLPFLKQNLSIPIVASGAITTGREIAAAMILGADLVYMGTRFINSSECLVSDSYKNLIIHSGIDDITYTDQFTKLPANFLKKTIPKETPATKPELFSYKAWVDIWSAGHGVSLVKDVKSIENIVKNLDIEYKDALKMLDLTFTS